MPKKAPGAKKARWTAAQKADARKAVKKPHRGQPDRPRSGPNLAARGEESAGARPAKRPRAERSPRWDSNDPRRRDNGARRGPDGSRGPRYSTGGSAWRDSATQDGPRGSRYSASPSTRDSRPTSDDGARRSGWGERHVHRPHDERPRRERGDRPVRDRGPRVADPARRDRHEGRHAERRDERGRQRLSDQDGYDRRVQSGYDRRDDRAARGSIAKRDKDRRRDDRRFESRDGRRPDGRSLAFEEAEIQRAEADTWTTYASSAGGPREVTADNGFAALGLAEQLVDRLARDGIVEPFPIQAATIPDALAGRDVLGRGRTGSGKTLAFGLPTLTRLAGRGRSAPRRPRALVLVPTRELAMQVSDALQPYVHVLGLQHRLVAGGLSYEPQISALRRGVDLLVATPGRLTDLMERGAVELDDVEVAVLDEADHMADMGFLPEVTAILDALPPGGQRLLFSATLDRGVDDLVERYLTDPVTHSTDEAQAAVTTMSHHVWLVGPHDKKALTAELAGRPGRVVVFARTQLGSDRIARELRERGVFAAALHGGLSQGVRNRVLGAFRDGRMPVLVATDVAARGIHVDDIGLVVQVDPPKDHKDYLHRAGRTARAGERGAVVMLALPHQRRMVAGLVEAAGADAETVSVVPGDATVRAIGGIAPSGHPVPDAVWRPVIEGGARGGRDRGGPHPSRPGRRGGPGPGGGGSRRPRDGDRRRGRMGE